MNNIIHRTLSAAGVPSRLEPPGLSRLDGKRPDGMTLVPWSSGRLLVWDATCPDTYAVTYRGQATTEAGCVASHAEEWKSGKYSHLSPTYLFQPVAIESSGALGPSTYIFLRELGKHVFQESGEANSTTAHQPPPPETLHSGTAGKCGGCYGVCPATLAHVIINNILYFILFYLPINCIITYNNI